MIRKIIALIAVIAFVGCAAARSPVGIGSIFTDIKGPTGATTNAETGKVGKATAKNYLGIIALGDASIEAAKGSVGITNVTHVDYETFTVLGLYAETTTIVHGN